MKKNCNNCQNEYEDTIKGKCRPCYRLYQKQWRLNNLDKFNASQTRYRKKNQKKTTAKQREWRKNNPDKAKNILIKSRHGITLDTYNAMSLEQNYLCKICSKSKKLYIDHDHKTGKVRGLLCDQCNKALGLLYDSVESINNAAKYLLNIK